MTKTISKSSYTNNNFSNCFGQTEIKLGSTKPTRDFNYVEDTALSERYFGSNKSVDEVINIGSGFEISVFDTVELIAKLMNKKLK